MAGLGAKTFFLHAVKNSDKTLENLIRGVHFGEDGVQSIMKVGEDSFDDYEKFKASPSVWEEIGEYFAPYQRYSVSFE